MTTRLLSVSPDSARARRRVLGRVGWKIAVVALADFLLLRVWGPNLINRHQDWALGVALLCFLGALLATLWLGYQLWIERANWGRLNSGFAARDPDMET